jgi:Protein of unknown function DUF58
MGLRSRFQAWFESRITLRDHTLLTQRNVYILPTWPGFMLAITLLVLLVTSINYQLNLGYVLTFMITGCAVVGMHVCHGTLRGLAMHLSTPEPVFAGSSVTLGINLACNRSSTRYGVGLGVLGTSHWAWTDVPALGSAVVHVTFTPQKRGLHHIPTLTAETRYPLGTFRVWTIWRAAAQVLVYPKAELHPPPLPPGTPQGAGTASTQQQSSGEYDGVRAYRRGDPRKQIVWKKAAKAQELVSRDTQQVQRSRAHRFAYRTQPRAAARAPVRLGCIGRKARPAIWAAPGPTRNCTLQRPGTYAQLPASPGPALSHTSHPDNCAHGPPAAMRSKMSFGR